MSKIKSAEDLLEQLKDIMPFRLSENIEPYIIEYGKLLQRQAVETALKFVAKEVNDKFDHTYVSNEFDIKPTIDLILNLKNSKDLKIV